MILKVGMADIDLLNNGTRYPNLAQMKMSGWAKAQGHEVKLLMPEDLARLSDYDIILASKVFNYTPIPDELMELIKRNTSELDPLETRYRAVNEPSVAGTLKQLSDKKPDTTRILIGGTGFFEDGGRDLDTEIDQHMPDYELYSEYVANKIKSGWKRSYFNDYFDCSMGFLTRGCFRKCSFCVNRKYDRAYVSTEDVSVFLKPGSKRIYLWDDNFLAIGRIKSIELLDKLIAADVPFQFRQGLDIRLMSDEVAEKLLHCRYNGEFIFAFDHIQDREIIVEKLKLWRRHTPRRATFYVLCGFDARSHDPKYGINLDMPDEEKDLIDIGNTFERIRILMEFGCIPYVMKHVLCRDSPYYGIYIQIARWCNQPNQFKKMSFEEFCLNQQNFIKSDKICASVRALTLLREAVPDIYEKYAKCKFMYAGGIEPTD